MAKRLFNQTPFNLYHQDRFVQINLIFSLLANLGLWLLLAWQIRGLGESMSLHYNIYFGIDLLGPWYQIFSLPAVGLIFFLLNFLIGVFIYSQEKILRYFLVGFSSFLQVIFILAALLIISINF